MTEYSYMGSELELFARALNWKAYSKELMSPYIGREVLEVGAGIGSTTKALCTEVYDRWLCLEPDALLFNKLKSLTTGGSLPKFCELRLGTLKDLGSEDLFDTIIFVDVLEHIQDDKTALRIASDRLKEKGFLIVMAPAHQELFTAFDEAVGHYRRYTKRTLSAIAPENLESINLRYIDSVGLIASLGNRLLLKRKIPTRWQIALWDKGMIPLSRKLDPLFSYSIGKSVFGVWQKRPT